MALVLLMEGTNQFVSWRHIIEYVNRNFDTVLNADTIDFTALNNTITTIFTNQFLPITEDVFENVTTLFQELQSPKVEGQEAANMYVEIILDLLKLVFDGYGFEPPEETAESEDPLAIINAYYDVFKLVFDYFAIAAGLVVIFLGILAWLSHSKGRHASRAYLGGIISKFVIGLGLVLLSTMTLSDAADNLGESAWTLPLMLFVLFIALIFDHLPYSSFKKSSGLPTNNARKPRKGLPWGNLKRTFSRKPSY